MPAAKTTTQKSSSARMERSRTWGKISPTNSGNSACWDAISIMRNFTPTRTAARFGRAFRAAANPIAPAFGHAAIVYNVIDARQAYLQNVVVAGLRALGFQEQADRSIHFSYEIVALTPRCAAELGYTLSEEDAKKPYVEVSGRKGLGVKADDLLDRLEAAARAEVDERHPDLTRRRASRDRARHRHRSAPVFPTKIHAHGDHCIRLQGRAQF